MLPLFHVAGITYESVGGKYARQIDDNSRPRRCWLLGLALFYIRATMIDLFSYAFGGALAVLLIASSLLSIAGLDWICATLLGCPHVHKLWGFLLFSTTAGACIVSLILYPGSTIRILCYAPGGLCFFIQFGQVWPCQIVEPRQEAASSHIHFRSNCARLRWLSGCVSRQR